MAKRYQRGNQKPFWFPASDYPFGIFWPLCCLSFDLRLLITPLVSFGHCIVCPSLIYVFWLPLWYLLTIVLSVLWSTSSDYPVGIFWPLCCLSFFFWPLWYIYKHNSQKIPKGKSEDINKRRTDNTKAKRYQRGNQKPKIKGQTTQWPKDTKGVIRSRKSKDRQHNGQKIPKG
jgi:hypothetical protein